MATTYTLAPDGKMYFWNATTGAPLAAGLVYTVSAGGSYPADAVTTYQTSSGTANANPIVLNSAGYCVIYLQPGQTYKFIVHDSSDVLVWTQDNIGAVPTSSQTVDVTATFGETVLASQMVYLSDGSGSKTPGSWYLADADFTYASSEAGEVGIVLADTAALAQGTVRVAGSAAYTLTSLVPGAGYYISATAGSVTSTAPSNQRFVGTADTAASIVLAANPPTGPSLNFVQIWAFC